LIDFFTCKRWWKLQRGQKKIARKASRVFSPSWCDALKKMSDNSLQRDARKQTAPQWPSTGSKQQSTQQSYHRSPEDEERQRKILLDLFRRLPTDYLLCSVRLACREWKRTIECEQAQQALWRQRAAYFETHALYVSTLCAQQQVQFESHRVGEERHRTTYSPLDRCLHYYTYATLWSVQRRICNSWMAHYYTSTGDMHRYWFSKHARAQRMANTFNEVDTELALKTVSASRSAALDAALTTCSGVPFTPPV